MLFIQRDDAIQNLPPPTSNPKLRSSASPFCQGACTLVRFGYKPAAFKKAVELPVPIEDDATVTAGLRKGSPQLLHDPIRPWDVLSRCSPQSCSIRAR